MPERVSIKRATEAVAGRDAVLDGLIAEAGPVRLRQPRMTHYGALVQAIVYQQLAGAAASAIHGRLLATMDGDPQPEPMLALDDQTLRTVGLSAAKVRSLRDLATKVLDGTVVLAPRAIGRLSDDEIKARLTTVRGIGPWSADMFLLFQLRRVDVWPVGDLGVRHGYALAWAIPRPTARELEPLGDPFRPYRTILACYCWRAAELRAGAAQSALTG